LTFFLPIKLGAISLQKSKSPFRPLAVEVRVKPIKWISTALWRCIAYLFNKKVSNRSNSSKSGKDKPSHIKWKIKVLDSRAILTAKLPSGRLFYNNLLGVIENDDGNILRGLNINPSVDTLNEYLRVLHSLDPPTLTENSLLLTDPNIRYDSTLDSYISVKSGKKLYGFRSPSSVHGLPL
jgi:hypothetical protein